MLFCEKETRTRCQLSTAPLGSCVVAQPEWILSDVLLSPDLAPHILAQLPTTEHAVKGTCRAWRRGWKETLPKRERPRMLVIGGEDIDGHVISCLAGAVRPVNE